MPSVDNPLALKIQAFIQKNGFISIDLFMHLALADPEFGYYTSHPAIGKNYDFTTAPEISQLFGEMLGFWIITIVNQLPANKDITLVELGAGRGTMLFDILTLLKKVPNIYNRLNIKILELNSALKKSQQHTLASLNNLNINWYDNLTTLLEQNTTNPFILIANEFFDCLPVKQYKYKENNWHEVMVTFQNNKAFNFVLNQNTSQINHLLPPTLEVKDGMFFEYSPASLPILGQISETLKSNKGAVLIIDYGYTESSMQSTLQAIKNHRPANFLSNIGENDLTALVNFHLLQQTILPYKFNCFLTTQREFLLNLGVMQRLEILLNIVTNLSEKNAIIEGVNRILDPNDMGTLFKVLCATNL